MKQWKICPKLIQSVLMTAIYGATGKKNPQAVTLEVSHQPLFKVFPHWSPEGVARCAASPSQ